MAKLFEKVNIENDINVSRELLTIELDKLLHNTNSINLSTEAIVSKSEGKTSILDRIKHTFIDAKDTIVGYVNLFLGYDVKKLQEYLQRLEDGTLVPRKEILANKEKSLQKKLGAFFVLGNKMDDPDDLIKYMQEPIDYFLEDKYGSLITKRLKSLFTLDTRKTKYKYKPTTINVDLSKIKLDLKITENQKDDIIISFLLQRFYHKLHIYTLLITDDFSSKDGFEWFDNMFLDNVDIIEVDEKYIDNIPIWSKEDAIKLLKWGIDNNKDIKSAINASKLSFLGYNVKGALEGVLYGLTGALAGGVYAIVGRFTNNLIPHVGNTMKDIIWYDKFIISIIDAMYEKTK